MILLYSHKLYIPLNINMSKLFKECKELNITHDKTETTRIYTFYGSEEHLRLIQTKYILKER